MPFKDPERQREYRRANREKYLENNRRWWAASRERLNEEQRVRAAQPGVQQQRYLKEKRKQDRDRIALELWNLQDGCCYLCEEPVSLEKAHLDHDHRCCPRKGPFSFCRACIRGVAHPWCNKAIGIFKDDPDRLELMTRNLRAKLAEVDARMAVKPIQGDLLAEGG